MKSEAHTQGSVTEEMPATADVSWSKWPSAFNVLTNLNASLELPLLSGSRGGRVSDTMSVFTKHRSGDAMTKQNQEVESSWEPPAPGLSSCPHVAVAEAVKWQNRIWEPRPECCYFWCFSMSGGEERRALHAAHDICCSLRPLPICTQAFSSCMKFISTVWRGRCCGHPIWEKMFVNVNILNRT